MVIKLKMINDVKDFCKKSSEFNGNVDVLSGRFAVSGESIMGLFALDLSLPITVLAKSDNKDKQAENEFYESIKKYVS